MKQLFITLLFLISGECALSQDTKKDSVKLSVKALDFIIKDIQNCDSLKARYQDQHNKINVYTKVNNALLKQKDSIVKNVLEANIRLKEMQQHLDKKNQKKGLNVLEGILIGIVSLGIGLSI